MSKIRLLGILGALTLGSTAMAKVPRFQRQEPKLQVSLSDRVKPWVATSPAVAKPTVQVDAVLSVRFVTAPIRVEQQQILEQLIANTADTQVDEKADYLFRLAELYASQHRYWRIKTSELQTHADAARDASTKTKLRNEVAAAAIKAKDFLLRAVKTYKALTDPKTFASYPKLDQALFGYGYTLQSGKYMKEARDVYFKLLRDHPSSKYVPEAHLVFAEYYFDAGQLADAEARYKQVLKFPKSAAYAYALYKLGWVNLSLQRFSQALEGFFQVAQMTRSDQTQTTIHRAAVLDFVRVYSEIGKADKAYAAFQRVDQPMAFEMLEALAQHYVEQGKLDRATYIQQELMKVAPTSARVCDWQYRNARAMLSMPGASNTDKVREIENLAKLARVLEAKAAMPAPALQDCRANAMAMSLELARAYHDEAQKTRNTETLGHAERLYQAFVDNFPDDPQRSEAQYLRAEALWSHAAAEASDRIQRDRWNTASVAFAELATFDRTRAPIAARASVLAYMNGNDDASLATAVIPPLTQGKPPPATPLSTEHQKLVDAIDVVASTARDPVDPEVGALRYLQANLYRRANQHDKAAKLFVDLVGSHPNETFSEAAAVLAIDSLIILQRLDQMLQLADRLAGDGAYLADKPELTKVIKLVRSRSMRR